MNHQQAVTNNPTTHEDVLKKVYEGEWTAEVRYIEHHGGKGVYTVRAGSKEEALEELHKSLSIRFGGMRGDIHDIVSLSPKWMYERMLARRQAMMIF